MSDLNSDADELETIDPDGILLLDVWSDLLSHGIQNATLSEAEALTILLIRKDVDGYRAKFDEIFNLEAARRDALAPKIIELVKAKTRITIGTPVVLVRDFNGELYAEPATPNEPMHGLIIQEDPQRVITQGVVHFDLPPDVDLPDVYYKGDEDAE